MWRKIRFVSLEEFRHFFFFFFFDFLYYDSRRTRFCIYTRRIRKSIAQGCWLLLLRRNNGYGYRPYSRTYWLFHCVVAAAFVRLFVTIVSRSLKQDFDLDAFLLGRNFAIVEKNCNDCKASSLTSSARRSDFNDSLLRSLLE